MSLTPSCRWILCAVACAIAGRCTHVAAGLVAPPACNSNMLKSSCEPSQPAIQTISTTDPAACCAACTADSKCISWTLNTERKLCYLHPGWSTPAHGDCSSGHVRPGPPPPPPPPAPKPAPKGAKNVLLLIVDDLRPEFMTTPYDEKFMITPNIDKLVSRGMAFNRAYCQQAICGPTRNSFLSGRRPQRTLSWNFENSFRQAPGGQDWITFPEYFKINGYTTLGTGKTFHPGLPPNFDEPRSWSQDEPYYMAPNGYPKCKEWPNSLVCPTNASLDTFGDYMDMARTVSQIDKYAAANASKPFFLAFGAHRPHLPWNMPMKYWDMYPPTEQIALPKHEAAPTGMPPIAFTYECDGMTKLTCFDKQYPIPYPDAATALPANVTRSFRKAYYASVTFTDSLIGLLLDKIEAVGHTEDTVVALIGDHGWQLGEHNIWGKHTNFELGARVPIVISAPGMPTGSSNALVESVDLYPTIASLAGLAKPDDLDGVDLTPLFSKPDVPLKHNVFSEYPRCPKNISTPWDDTSSCVHTDRKLFTSMGYSVRNQDYRYTVWLHWDGDKLVGDFSKPPIGVELYTHVGDTESDFDNFENSNMANDPSLAATVKQMYAVALAHWGQARPSVAPLKGDGVVGSEALTPAERALHFEEWN